MDKSGICSVSESVAILHGGVRPSHVQPEPLSEILRRTAATSIHGIHFISLNNEPEIQSYKTLFEEARTIACGLKNCGVVAGEKVILQFQRPADFLPSFWGCILGGFVVVPIGVPIEYNAVNLQSRSLQHAFRFLDSPYILTSADSVDSIQDLLKEDAKARLRVHTREEIKNRANGFNFHESSLTDTAAILTTSGTTGGPKFVPINHLNFFSSMAGSALMLDLGSKDISLNWLPFHHVSVLMRSIRDLYAGCMQIQARTADVLAEPLQWIDWIHQYRVTTTWAPNFAFAHVVESMQQPVNRAWDLSSVRSIAAAGEPVKIRTVEKFAELLEPFGLRRNALHVSWGMTEACFASCSLDSFATKHDERRLFASVGQPIAGSSIRITDDQDTVMLNGVAGNVQVRGDLVTAGYYSDADLNKNGFTNDGWLRTGDTGVIENGSLTIIGRTKDLIVIHGVKYSLAAIESIVERMEGIVPLSVAVCIVRREEATTEDFVLFFQPASPNEREWAGLISRLRIEIHQRMGIVPLHVIPLDRSRLPKSAGGKLLRAELRDQYERGDFDPLLQKVETLAASSFFRKRSASSVHESTIADSFCSVLKRSSVQPQDNFFDLGGNSIQAIQIAARLSKLFPDKNISAIDIIARPTVQKLAEYVGGTVKEIDPVATAIERAELRKSLLMQRREAKERYKG